MNINEEKNPAKLIKFKSFGRQYLNHLEYNIVCNFNFIFYGKNGSLAL